MRASGKDDALMLAVLGALAYGASMATHEALGHGLFCLALGDRNVMLSAWAERCEPHPFGIEAAGPAVQFAAGLLAWALLHLVPGRAVRLRFLLWASMAFDLLVPSGYVMQSGASGFGDAAVLVNALSYAPLWRGLLILFGAGTYYGAMLASAFELRRLTGDDQARAKRLALVPYLAAGVIACFGGAINRTMPGFSGPILAAASSFGGGIGLLVLPATGIHASQQTSAPALTRNAGWTAAGCIGIAAFVFVLGRGIE